MQTFQIDLEMTREDELDDDQANSLTDSIDFNE